MSTTTIRLPQDLKKRIARAAERAGSTAHSFILEAIAEKAEQEERQGEFQDTAEQRYAEILASGKTVPWGEMRRYLERRLTGNKIARPKPRTLSRIELAPEVGDDFDRILNHLVEHEAADAKSHIEDILRAIDVLERNPLIGRRVRADL